MVCGYELDQLEEWWDDGLILTKKDGTPRMAGLKVYLDEKEGKTLQSVWTDIENSVTTFKKAVKAIMEEQSPLF